MGDAVTEWQDLILGLIEMGADVHQSTSNAVRTNRVWLLVLFMTVLALMTVVAVEVLRTSDQAKRIERLEERCR